ncbi:ankyrin repeat domain-containing protein [Psychrobacillus sp. OK032]|uniref:ankyrin repeat domain-containing protein n=1 Tax=Psychrobacillus sp. OK032 TaxID=1884358 RepID=UPI0008AF2D41|nr:ankyrin repeat domain-containing protein [Psychrobacillus sp. OK032]SES44490.1 hypothetical protein SAMN05518872_11425 [Psychrobacillus sp. OK032]
MTTIIGFFGALLIAFLALCVILFLWANFSGKKNDSELATFMTKNNITQYKFIRFNWDHLIYDYERNGLWFYNHRKGFKFINKQSIFECEIKIDDNTEYRTSISDAAGRAIVGGLLLGGVGAIIGGVTGRKNSKNLVHKVTLIIYFDSIHGDNGYKEIEVFSNHNGCEMDNSEFRNDYNRAMSWCKFIEQQKNTNTVKSNFTENIPEGNKLLINSILNNDVEGVILSFDKYKAGAHSKSQTGQTALELAIQKDNKYIVAYLIKYGAFPNAHEVETALKYGNNEIIKMVKSGNHKKIISDFELLRKTI